MKHVRYSAPMLLILLLAAIPLIVQCTTSSQTSARFSAVEKDPLIGSWVQPAPGSDGKVVQGFTLYPDGTAKSINMATLLYKKWKRVGKDKLVLTAESIGIHTRSTDDEIYIIKHLDDKKLVLSIPAEGTKDSSWDTVYYRK